MKKENYKLSSHIDMHIMLAAHLDLGLFNLRVNACWGPATEYMYTKFGVNSSCHFPVANTTWYPECQPVDGVDGQPL